jgi:peptidoglycan/LPS O-acetylase OafA/YrhL
LIIWPAPGDYLVETAATALYLIPVLHVLSGGDVVWYHMWTLAIEEWFYLVWPLALALILRLRMSYRRIALLVALAGMLMLAGKVALALAGFEFGAYLRAGGLLVGGALALFLAAGPRRAPSPWWPTVGFGCVVVAVACGGNVLLEPFTYPLAVVGTATMIPALIWQQSRWSRALSWSGLVWAGKRSYEMYLWHYPVVVLAAQATGMPHNKIWWWVGPLSLALAFASYRCTSPLSARWKSKVRYTEPLRKEPIGNTPDEREAVGETDQASSAT